MPKLHGCWQKTRDTCIKDQGFYSSQNKNHELHCYIGFPCPLPHLFLLGQCRMSQINASPSGFVSQRRTPSLGNLGVCFFIMDCKPTSPLCPGGVLSSLCWKANKLPLHSGGSHSLHFPKILTEKHSRKDTLKQNLSVPLCARSAEI